jgi:hypothetical protein
MSSTQVGTLVGALVVLSLAPACSLKARFAGTDASGAEDVSGTESDLESLGTSLVSSNGQSVATSSAGGTGGLKLQDTIATGTNVGAWFQPAGCIVATVDATTKTATYVFAGCTGPLGLVELDGTVDVTWSDSAGQLTINYAAQNFMINRATINTWHATAVITASGDSRHMTWDATLNGTTGRGRSFTRTNDKVVDWTVGQPCVTVSGQSDGTILGVELKTTIVSYSRCAAECPQAGSEISVVNESNHNTIDIKYEGGPDAQLTVNGKETDITLACGG